MRPINHPLLLRSAGIQVLVSYIRQLSNITVKDLTKANCLHVQVIENKGICFTFDYSATYMYNQFFSLPSYGFTGMHQYNYFLKDIDYEYK